MFANHDTRSGSAPRASTDSRASVPIASTRSAPRTNGGTTAPLTARRQPGRGSASLLSTTSTYGTPRGAAPRERRLRRERAPAGDDDDVRPRVLELAHDPRRDRVVVAEDVPHARDPPAVHERGAVLRDDRPPAAEDRVAGVDDAEVELRPLRDAVEHDRAERRRLGRDVGDADALRGRRVELPQRLARVAARLPRERGPARAGSATSVGSVGTSASARFRSPARASVRAAASRTSSPRPWRATRRPRSSARTPRRSPAPSPLPSSQAPSASSGESSGATAAISRSATSRWKSRCTSRRRFVACRSWTR